ncbi:unnamed protein product [Candidula unifasciata]|uniref:Methyltransferase domain-containing protein n=1 Tax=Candidula unifasciata TaxID=100452 RepID=A0A8S3ZL56_9EUPU|nr:unnamed protein product [Candidula unifasciata]
MEQQIKDALSFLNQWDWIHNFQVKDIFVKEVFETIPLEWLAHLQKLETKEINELPFMDTLCKHMHPDWPPSLHSFICEASHLSVDRTQTQAIAPAAVDANMARGMIPKKFHEVSWMASLVNDIVCKTDCNLVVDVGSGLGYLDHVLHQVYGHAVIGLETSQSHTCAAEVRAADQGITCLGFKSIKFDVTDDENCFQKFQDVIRSSPVSFHCIHSKLQNTQESSQPFLPKVCLIGLHCCGDLSSAMLSLFHHTDFVRAVCCVCCCYHKMAFTDGKFLKFPMSLTGQKYYQDLQKRLGSWQLSPCTLRLGAQETRSRWRAQTLDDHANHIRHVAFRGLLEMLDFEDSATVRKKVRKCDFSSFENFLQSYFKSCNVSEELRETVISALRKLHEKHNDKFDFIEIITCLQMIVQPVIEALIYRDKVSWLLERGWTDVNVIPIFDELLSPRNLAIVAIKPS